MELEVSWKVSYINSFIDYPTLHLRTLISDYRLY